MRRDEQDVWLEGVSRLPTSHSDERPEDRQQMQSIDLLVIHNISLPPAKCESDFDNDHVEAFFTGRLDCSLHPIFEQLRGVRVSSHLYIKRCGAIFQFVPLNRRAWHAGVSEFQGRSRCNDFSIGIELQGTDTLAYTQAQYDALANVTRQIRHLCPNISLDNIVGHSDIAPGRKTDPGLAFDWLRYKNQI